MTAAAQKLLREALQLPEGERHDLMVALSESFEAEPAEIPDALRTELQSRIEDLESGRVVAVAWADVEQQIRTSLASER